MIAYHIPPVIPLILAVLAIPLVEYPAETLGVARISVKTLRAEVMDTPGVEGHVILAESDVREPRYTAAIIYKLMVTGGLHTMSEDKLAKLLPVIAQSVVYITHHTSIAFVSISSPSALDYLLEQRFAMLRRQAGDEYEEYVVERMYEMVKKAVKSRGALVPVVMLYGYGHTARQAIDNLVNYAANISTSFRLSQIMLKSVDREELSSLLAQVPIVSTMVV